MHTMAGLYLHVPDMVIAKNSFLGYLESVGREKVHFF